MDNKAIVIVGMHRSGTSALSGLLNDLGVFMGKNLFGPQKGVNEKGFFENSQIVRINEELFDEACSSWDDPLANCFIKNNTFDENSWLYSDALSTVMAEYACHKLWAMKDPRTSINLEFWQRIFSDLNVEPYYIIMLRDPLEVAASLEKRDRFSRKKSLMLWINYTLSSYMQCIDKQCYILNYGKLLSEPETVILELKNTLGVTLDSTKTSFIDRKLRHQANNEIMKTTDDVSRIALALYNELSEQEPSHTNIVNLLLEYQQYLASLTDVLIEHLAIVKRDEIHFRKLFEKAYRSIWWKLNWPLRRLEYYFFKS